MTPVKRISAGFTLFFFLLSSLSPVSFAAPSVQTFPGVSETPASAPFSLDLPAHLGTIENLKSGTGPAIIQIQTAHGNYEAQKKIQGILEYLNKKHGFKTLLLEGSPFKLHPELLNFFPDNSALTQKVADRLTHEALIQGPELFLLDHPEAQAYGIEELKTYVDNGRAFKEVLRQQEKTQAFLKDMDMQIDRLASPFLRKDLRSFLKRLEDFEARRMSFPDWLNYLKDQAEKKADLRLGDAAYQVDWPMLVRLFTLIEIEKKMDAALLETEKQEFLKAAAGLPQPVYAGIESLLNVRVTRNQLPDPDTRILFEKMVELLPADFNYKKFPNVKLFIGHLILQSELKADILMAEEARLTEKISAALAASPQEKKVLALLKDYRLLKKLFALELSPQDYENLVSRTGEITPSLAAGRFLEINESKRVKNIQFQHLPEIDSLFLKALEFYRLVKERDQLMTANSAQKIKELGAEKVVIVTGGFHSEPFQNFFSQLGYSYALISPSITNIEGDGGRESYVTAVLEGMAGLETQTYSQPQTYAQTETENLPLQGAPRFAASRLALGTAAELNTAAQDVQDLIVESAWAKANPQAFEGVFEIDETKLDEELEGITARAEARSKLGGREFLDNGLINQIRFSYEGPDGSEYDVLLWLNRDSGSSESIENETRVYDISVLPGYEVQNPGDLESKGRYQTFVTLRFDAERKLVSWTDLDIPERREKLNPGITDAVNNALRNLTGQSFVRTGARSEARSEIRQDMGLYSFSVLDYGQRISTTMWVPDGTKQNDAAIERYVRERHPSAQNIQYTGQRAEVARNPKVVSARSEARTVKFSSADQDAAIETAARTTLSAHPAALELFLDHFRVFRAAGFTDLSLEAPNLNDPRYAKFSAPGKRHSIALANGPMILFHRPGSKSTGLPHLMADGVTKVASSSSFSGDTIQIRLRPSAFAIFSEKRFALTPKALQRYVEFVEDSQAADAEGDSPVFVPAAKSETRIDRRRFFTAGLTAAAAVALLEDGSVARKAAAKDAKLDPIDNPAFAELSKAVFKGLANLRGQDGILRNFPAGSIKTSAIGFSLSASMLDYLNNGKKPAQLKEILRVLKTYEKLVEQFGLKIDKDFKAGFGPKFTGTPTGMIPETLGRKTADEFQIEFTNADGIVDKDAILKKTAKVSYSAVEMALIHERMIYLRQFLEEELALVKDKDKEKEGSITESLKILKGLLENISYRPFIEGRNDGDIMVARVRVSDVRNNQKPEFAQKSFDYPLDNKHTAEAVTLLPLIEMGYLGDPSGKLEERKKQGERVWDNMTFRWKLVKVGDGENETRAVALGDADTSALSEYGPHIWHPAGKWAPGSFGLSAQNFYYSYEYFSKKAGHKVIGSAPGTPKRQNTQASAFFGLGGKEGQLNNFTFEFSQVPYGIFLMAAGLETEETIKNAELFLTLVKKANSFAFPSWGLYDTYDPFTLKPNQLIALAPHLVRIQEALFKEQLRDLASRAPVFEFVKKKIEGVDKDRRHQIEEYMKKGPRVKPLDFFGNILKANKAQVDVTLPAYKAKNNVVIDTTQKLIRAKYAVDMKNVETRMKFGMSELEMSEVFTGLEITYKDGGKPQDVNATTAIVDGVEFYDDKGQLIGDRAPTTGEVRPGVINFDVARLTTAAKNQKIATMVLVFKGDKTGGITITKSEFVSRSEVRGLSRRAFLVRSAAAGVSALLGDVTEGAAQEVKPEDLAGEIFKGLISSVGRLRNPRGLLYNQVAEENGKTSFEFAWIKSGDVGFSLTSLMAAYMNSKIEAERNTALSNIFLALETHEQMVADYGLKISKDGIAGYGKDFEGLQTGVLPEVMGKDKNKKDFFRAEPERNGGKVVYAAFDMALTHERMIYLQQFLKDEQAKGKKEVIAKSLKVLDGLLKNISYTPFIDENQKLHQQLIVSDKKNQKLELTKDLIDNKHTEAAAFLALIGMGYLGPQGEKVWDSFTFEWKEQPVSANDKEPVAVGDGKSTPWTEYYPFLFYPAGKLAPETLGVSAANFFAAYAYAAVNAGHELIGSAPGTGRGGGYGIFGISSVIDPNYASVPYGVFLMAASGDKDALANAKKFLDKVKEANGKRYHPQWTLVDSYDPKSGKANAVKVISMNQALILEALQAEQFRAIAAKTPTAKFVERKLRQIDADHPIPAAIKKARPVDLMEIILKENKSGGLADNPAPELDAKKKTITVKHDVAKDKFGGVWFGVPAAALDEGHKFLEVTVAKNGELPAEIKVEIKDADKKWIGEPVVSSGELKPGVIRIDISKIAAASKDKKTAELVFVFGKPGKGTFTMTGMRLVSRTEMRAVDWSFDEKQLEEDLTLPLNQERNVPELPEARSDMRGSKSREVLGMLIQVPNAAETGRTGTGSDSTTRSVVSAQGLSSNLAADFRVSGQPGSTVSSFGSEAVSNVTVTVLRQTVLPGTLDISTGVPAPSLIVLDLDADSGRKVAEKIALPKSIPARTYDLDPEYKSGPALIVTPANRQNPAKVEAFAVNNQVYPFKPSQIPPAAEAAEILKLELRPAVFYDAKSVTNFSTQTGPYEAVISIARAEVRQDLTNLPVSVLVAEAQKELDTQVPDPLHLRELAYNRKTVDPVVIPFLISVLKNPRAVTEAVFYARTGLKSLGVQALPFVLRLLEDGSTSLEKGRGIESIKADISSFTAIPFLIKIFLNKDNPAYLRDAALQRLSKIVVPGVSVTGTPSADILGLAEFAMDLKQDGKRRLKVLRILNALGAPSASAFTTLINIALTRETDTFNLEDQSPVETIPAAARRLVVRLARETLYQREILEYLLKRTQNPLAIQILGEIGPAAESAALPLVELIKSGRPDFDNDLKTEAAAALTRILQPLTKAPVPRLVSGLIEIIQQEKLPVSVLVNAISALGIIGAPAKSALIDLRGLQGNGNPAEVKTAATNAILFIEGRAELRLVAAQTLNAAGFNTSIDRQSQLPSAQNPLRPETGLLPQDETPVQPADGISVASAPLTQSEFRVTNLFTFRILPFRRFVLTLALAGLSAAAALAASVTGGRVETDSARQQLDSSLDEAAAPGRELALADDFAKRVAGIGNNVNQARGNDGRIAIDSKILSSLAEQNPKIFAELIKAFVQIQPEGRPAMATVLPSDKTSLQFFKQLSTAIRNSGIVSESEREGLIARLTTLIQVLPVAAGKNAEKTLAGFSQDNQGIAYIGFKELTDVDENAQLVFEERIGLKKSRAAYTLVIAIALMKPLADLLMGIRDPAQRHAVIRQYMASQLSLAAQGKSNAFYVTSAKLGAMLKNFMTSRLVAVMA